MATKADRRHATTVLSCTSCRERKTRCDRTQPTCLQCSRFDLVCVWPSRKKTRRAPRPRQRELLDRISRLETIVGEADPEKLKALDAADRTASSPSDAASDPDARSSVLPSDPTGTPPRRKDQRLTGATAKYLSADFWSNLSNEVEGIKQALDQSSDEDEGDLIIGESPESYDTGSSPPGWSPGGAFIIGSSFAHDLSQLGLSHPPSGLRAKLWAMWLRNCDPLIKITHRPTMEAELRKLDGLAPGQVAPLRPAMHAVLFAMYLSAATSLSPEGCLQHLGESRETLVSTYWPATEKALAAADYLNTTEIETLQAFAIYLSILRTNARGRSAWALTALLIRLAQAMNLHRDGDGSRFTPFEAEMRRRLWHFIIVLDIRGSEDRGTDAIISRASYDTLPPTPINDVDFSPASVGPLIPRHTGPADNVVCLCTARCSGLVGSLSHPSGRNTGEHFVLTQDELIADVRRLEEDFIHAADPAHMPSILAANISRNVILRLWLVIQYPFFTAPGVARPRIGRETMLRTAINLLELSERMIQPPWYDRFAWWNDTYSPWHALAVALAELCVQTRGSLVDRAWEDVDRMYPLWKDKVADSARGALWRPIRKLLKKAKAARSEALSEDMRLGVSEAKRPSTEAATTVAAEQWPMDCPPTTPPQQPAPVQPLPESFASVDMNGMPLGQLNMDPSQLFQYSDDLLSVGLGSLGLDPSGVSPWMEFVQDTGMGEGSFQAYY